MCAKVLSKGMGGAVTATGALPVEKYRYTPTITSTTPSKTPTMRPLNILSPVVFFLSQHVDLDAIRESRLKRTTQMRVSLRFSPRLCTFEFWNKENFRKSDAL